MNENQFSQSSRIIANFDTLLAKGLATPTSFQGWQSGAVVKALAHHQFAQVSFPEWSSCVG